MITAPRPRVLFMINSLIGGGAERVMATLLHFSFEQRAAFDIHLALLDEEAIAYPPPDWVTVHRLDCRHGLLGSVRRAVRLVRRLRPAVTLSFLTRANIANVIASRIARCPAVISERVDTSVHLGDSAAGRLKKWLVRRCYRRARMVIAVSAGVAADLRTNFGVAERRIVVIANPVDAAAIRERARAAPANPLPDLFVAAAGRLVPNKNFALLLRAFARSGLDGDLLILGEGPERAALTELARTLGIADRLHLPGFADNPFAILRPARMFVLPSNAEGFPNGLVEAMTLGLPVISTNCASGPAEILAAADRASIGGATRAAFGILVPPNAEIDLAEAMQALRDPALNAQYRERAVVRASDYAPSVAAQLYWGVLRDVMANPDRQPAAVTSRGVAPVPPGGGQASGGRNSASTTAMIRSR